MAPLSPCPPLLSTLICQGGAQGELRQWSYVASEVQRDAGGDDNARRGGGGGGQGRSEGGDKGEGLVVSRKLTHQVGLVGGRGGGGVALRCRGVNTRLSAACLPGLQAPDGHFISRRSKTNVYICLFVVVWCDVV